MNQPQANRQRLVKSKSGFGIGKPLVNTKKHASNINKIQYFGRFGIVCRGV